jgi:hypothetical protein
VSPTTGKKLQRGFCQFVMAPICRLIKGCLAGPERREALDRHLHQLGVELKLAERELEGKDLMKCVMPKFLPLAPVRRPFTVLARLSACALLTRECGAVYVCRRSWR